MNWKYGTHVKYVYKVALIITSTHTHKHISTVVLLCTFSPMSWVNILINFMTFYCISLYKIFSLQPPISWSKLWKNNTFCCTSGRGIWKTKALLRICACSNCAPNPTLHLWNQNCAPGFLLQATGSFKNTQIPGKVENIMSHERFLYFCFCLCSSHWFKLSRAFWYKNLAADVRLSAYIFRPQSIKSDQTTPMQSWWSRLAQFLTLKIWINYNKGCFVLSHE